jgi:hypothetical protein
MGFDPRGYGNPVVKTVTAYANDMYKVTWQCSASCE